MRFVAVAWGRTDLPPVCAYPPSGARLTLAPLPWGPGRAPFSWGEAGPGADALACALLFLATGLQALSASLAPAFAREFLEGRGPAWALTSAEVVTWVARQEWLPMSHRRPGQEGACREA
jgi:hypothetical protein